MYYSYNISNVTYLFLFPSSLESPLVAALVHHPAGLLADGCPVDLLSNHALRLCTPVRLYGVFSDQ